MNETFAKCTDANRQAVETELKQAIYHAFQAGDLWSTDWAKYKLDRCVCRRLILDRGNAVNLAFVLDLQSEPGEEAKVSRLGCHVPGVKEDSFLTRLAALDSEGLSRPRPPPTGLRPASRKSKIEERSERGGLISRKVVPVQAQTRMRRRGPRAGSCKAACTRTEISVEGRRRTRMRRMIR